MATLELIPAPLQPKVPEAPVIVRSQPMVALFRLVERIAQTDAAVLITGETGTGKDVVARAIHRHSRRCSGPWIDINCSSMPEHLMESELFGYEKGAFSGADRGKPGFFELAAGGTLFLDEVGELEPRLQAKLLRVLDGIPYYRLGGTRKIGVDVRIVAATNRDLTQETSAGRFRLDLFHRIGQVQLAVPPLRERPDDSIALAELFLRETGAQMEFAADALEYITRYSWPGNIRELRNVVITASLSASGRVIHAADLRIGLPETGCDGLNIELMERRLIAQALDVSGGRHQKAADLLGISVRTLSRKLRATV